MEMILALTIFAIVTSASVGVFHAGLQIWKRSQGKSAWDRKAVLALEKMGRDVRMALRVSAPQDGFSLTKKKWPEYEGTGQKFFFPAVVRFMDRQGRLKTEMGGVGYEWNAGTHELCKRVKGVSHFYSGQEPDCQVVAKGIENFKFQYWISRGIMKSYSWYDEWEPSGGLPRAVSVSFELLTRDAKGVSTRKAYKRDFLIPAAVTAPPAPAGGTP